VNLRIVGVALAVVTLSLFVAAPTASAETIALTGGTLSQSEDPTGGRIIAPGFDISFLSNIGAFPMFLAPGSLVDFSGPHLLLGSWSSPVVEGRRVGDAWVTGAFDISAVPVVVGESFSAPFSLTGTITGRARADAASPLLFSIDVSGAGTMVSGGPLIHMPAPAIRIDAATFRIDPVDPPAAHTPEPATWLLLASGCAGLCVHLRKRQR
jgi:hypothetical protein